MRQIVLFLIVGVLLFIGCGGKADSTRDQADSGSKTSDSLVEGEFIKVMYFTTKPHIFVDEDTGQLQGAAYELLETKLAPEMGIKIVWDKVATAVPRQEEILKTKENYVGLVLSKTPAREEMALYPEPYYQGNTAISVLKDNPLTSISKVEDIISLKIGYAEKTFISPIMRDERINFEFISDPNFNETNFKKMLAGRIDAVYAPDRASLSTTVSEMKISDKVKFLNLPEKVNLIYMVFTKDLSPLVEKYNKAFEKLNARKLYIELLSKYMDVELL